MYSAQTLPKNSFLLQLRQRQKCNRSKNRFKKCSQFSPVMKMFDNDPHPLSKNALASTKEQVKQTFPVVVQTTRKKQQSFTLSLSSLRRDIKRHNSCPRRPSLSPLYTTSFLSVLPCLFHFILFLSVLQQRVFCSPSSSLSSSSSSSSLSSSIVSAPESVLASLVNSSDAMNSAASSVPKLLPPPPPPPPPFTFSHHHHRSHLHLSKLFFPLATSSFPLESSSSSALSSSSSFKSSSASSTTSQPKQSNQFFRQGRQASFRNSSSFSRTTASSTAHRDPVSRKRKRELFALTISETEPLKALHPGNAFWSTGSSSSGSGSSGGSRRRRVSSLHGGNKVLKPAFSVFNPMAEYSSSSSAVAAMSAGSANAAAAAAAAAASAGGGNLRMKILLPPPPGFGVGLLPDQKCNFEVYPSGCFDENGSICDSSSGSGSGSNLCVCRPGYSIRIASLYCLRPASIGEACYTTEQCERKVQYSGCFSYREEYREENPSAFFGPAQSSWPMGECRCRAGHRYDQLSKSCVRSLIGSWCSNVWDCQMVEEGDGSGPSGVDGGGEGVISSLRQTSSFTLHGSISSNHSSGRSHLVGLPVQMLPWHSGPGTLHSSAFSTASLHGNSRAKMANIVCENKVCSCAPFFHYNSTAEECQHVETYGQPCRPSGKSGAENQLAMLSASAVGRGSSGKRSTRMRGSSSVASGSYVLSSRRHSASSSSFSSSFSSSSYHYRQRRSLSDNEVGGGGSGVLSRLGGGGGPLVSCTLPTVCSVNGSCVCAEGFEYQAGSSPQCQGVTHHGFHKGEKNGHSGSAYERGFEGHSNVGNFVEYVLYVLVPALIVILMFKPCFRRIGEWRTHIHQYNSDSDFYLAGNAPVLAGDHACNVIGASGEKVLPAGAGALGGGAQYSTPFSAFSSHALAGCAGHAGPFLFESVDGCVYGGCLTSQGMPANGVPSAAADPSLALVREKLQTIEETQSEDGGGGGGGGGGAGSACNLSSAASNEAGGCSSCLAAMAAGDSQQQQQQQQCCSWGHVLSTPAQSANGVGGGGGVHRESPQLQLQQQQQHQQTANSEVQPGSDCNERMSSGPNGCSGKGITEKADGMEMIQFSKDQQQTQQQQQHQHQQECSTDREMDHSNNEISEMI